VVKSESPEVRKSVSSVDGQVVKSESPEVRKSGSCADGLMEKSESREVRKSVSSVDGQMVKSGSSLSNARSSCLSDFRTSRLSDFTLQQCFFGEHLLVENPDAIIAITESEKTAVMASIMMPQFIWLAAGSLYGLQADKCRVLQNRQVVLFPDVGAYSYWADCARTLNLKIPTANFTVHTEMEQTATPHERTTGADMADRWIAEWEEMKGLAQSCELQVISCR